MNAEFRKAREDKMQYRRRAVIVACSLVSIQCSEAIAPATNASPPTVPPTTVSGRIAFVTEVSSAGGYVYVANADGSGLRQLPGGLAFYSRPRWSPDGRHLLVARWQPETSTSSIFVIDVDGQAGFVKLAQGHHPAWSPDGSRIVFASAGTSSWPDFGIHVMDADGRNVKRLTYANDAAQCRDGSSAGDLKPDWSPDGRRIVFERQFYTDDGGYDCGLDGWGYIPNVYTMNVDGTGVRRLRSESKTRSDSDPAWSPDGRSIAYAVPFDGLYVTDSEGGNAPRRIGLQNLNAGFPVRPAWSSDGKRLLFLGVQPPNNFLGVVDVESGNARVIIIGSVPGLLLDPAWSR